MNKLSFKILTLCLAALAIAVPDAFASRQQRAARRFIAEGNELYQQQRYAEAEVQYNKAIQQDPSNDIATYNLAMATLRQAQPGQAGEEMYKKAAGMLQDVMRNASQPSMRELAAYNLGNMSYNAQQWDQAIEFYKQALRINPDNDRARQNLRMAQLKKQEQQQNPQDQQQEQNQDQNQNQDNQDQKNDEQPQQPPKPKPGEISDENAEQILRAMEQQEAATRRRIQENERRNAARRVVTRPW